MWFSTKKIVERPKFIQKIIRVLGIIAIAGLVIGVRELSLQFPQAFPEWKTGILVARIGGDVKNSIQQDLVNKLNAELEKEMILLGVEARSFPVMITQAMGHEEARKIGKKYHAKLVIWGRRDSGLKNGSIHLRITVISDEYLSTPITGQPFKAQVVEEVKLPPVSVENPVLLIHFVLAKSYFDQYEFEKAKGEFEKCLNQPQKDTAYENSIRFWLAITYVDLGRYRAKTEFMEKAIDIYRSFLGVWTEQDFPVDWAATQHNLGLAYGELPTGDRGENLKKAIECYESALRVRTEQDFPLDWAATQHNLGLAYSELPTGNRGENLKKAIECYESALRVRTERDFPLDWAATQHDLGVAYSEYPIGDQRDNLEKAIQCFRNTLRIWTEEKFPYDYETTQQALTTAIKKLTEKIKQD